MAQSPDEINRLYSEIRQNDLPSKLDGRTGTNELVAKYRAKLAEQGTYDPRSDSELTTFIGDQLRNTQASEGSAGMRALVAESVNPEFRDDYLDLDLQNQDSGMLDEFGGGLNKATRGMVGSMSGGYGMTGLPGGEAAFQWGVDLQTNAPRASVRKYEDLFRANGISGKALREYSANILGQAIPSLVEGVAAYFIGSGTAGTGAAAIYSGKAAVKKGVASKMRQDLRKSMAQKVTRKNPTYGVGHKAVLEGRKRAGEIMDVEDYAAQLWKMRGGMGASTLNSLALNSGEIYNTLRGDGFSHEEAQAPALAYGSIAALPDSILPAWVGRSFLKRANLMGESQAVKDGALTWLGKQVQRSKDSTLGKVGIGMALEGSTEGFQEFINTAAPKWERGEDVEWDDFTKSKVINASIIGAVAGSIGGGLTAVGKGSTPPAPDQTDLSSNTSSYSDQTIDTSKQGAIVSYTGSSGTPQIGRVVRTTGEGTSIEPILDFDFSGEVAGIGRTGPVVTIPTESITGVPTAEDLMRVQQASAQGQADLQAEADVRTESATAEFGPIIEAEEKRRSQERQKEREALERERDSIEQDLANPPDMLAEGDARLDPDYDANARLAEVEKLLEKFPDVETNLITEEEVTEPAVTEPATEVSGFQFISGPTAKEPNKPDKLIEPVQVKLIESIIRQGIKNGKTNLEIQRDLLNRGFSATEAGQKLKSDGSVRFLRNDNASDRFETIVNKLRDSESITLKDLLDPAKPKTDFSSLDEAIAKDKESEPTEEEYRQAREEVEGQSSEDDFTKRNLEIGGGNISYTKTKEYAKLSTEDQKQVYDLEVLINRLGSGYYLEGGWDGQSIFNEVNDRYNDLGILPVSIDTESIKKLSWDQIAEKAKKRFEAITKQKVADIGIDTELDQDAAIEKRAKELAAARVKSNPKPEAASTKPAQKGESLLSELQGIGKDPEKPTESKDQLAKKLKSLVNQKKAAKAKLNKLVSEGRTQKNGGKFKSANSKKYKAHRVKIEEQRKKLKGIEQEIENFKKGTPKPATTQAEEENKEDTPKPKKKPAPKIDQRRIAKAQEDLEKANEAVRVAQAEVDQASQGRVKKTGKDALVSVTPLAARESKLKDAKALQGAAQRELDHAKGIDLSDPLVKLDRLLGNEPDSPQKTASIKKQDSDKQKKVVKAQRGGAKRKGAKLQHSSPTGQVDEYSVTEIDDIGSIKSYKSKDGRDYNARKKTIVDDIRSKTQDFNEGFITPEELTKLIKEEFSEVGTTTERWVLEVADDILQDLRRRVGSGASNKQLHRIRVLEIYNNFRREPISVQHEVIEGVTSTKTWQFFYPVTKREYTDLDGKTRGGQGIAISGSVDASNPVSAALGVQGLMNKEQFDRATKAGNLQNPLNADGEIMSMGVLFNTNSYEKSTLRKYYYGIRLGGAKTNKPLGYSKDFDDGQGSRPIAFLILKDANGTYITDHTGRRIKVVNPAGEVVKNPDSIVVPKSDSAIQVYRTKAGQNPQWATVGTEIDVAGQDASSIITTLRDKDTGGNGSTTNLGGKKGDRYRTRGVIILESPNGSIVMSGLSDFTSDTRKGSSAAGSLGVLGMLNSKNNIELSRSNKPAKLQDVIDAGFKPISVIRLEKFMKGEDKTIDSLNGYPEQKTWKTLSDYKDWVEPIKTGTTGTRQSNLDTPRSEILQSIPKIASVLLDRNLTVRQLDRFLTLIRKDYVPRSPEDLANLFNGANKDAILARINTLIDARLPSDFLMWDDVFISITQNNSSPAEHLIKVAEAAVDAQNKSIADSTPIQSDEIIEEIEESPEVKVTENDYIQAEKELRSEGTWMPSPLPASERSTYGVNNRAKRIAEAREGKVKRRISDTNHEISKSIELDRDFTQLLEALSKSGVDVQLFKKNMESVYGFLHANNAEISTNEADTIIRMVMNDLLRPDGTNILSLYHESTHFVLDSLPEMDRQALLNAIHETSKEFGNKHLKKRMERARNKYDEGRLSLDQLREIESAEEVLVETVAKNLADTNIKKGTIRAVIRKIREVFYQIYRAVAEAAGFDPMIAADLSEKYLRVKMEQFIARDNETLPPFLSWLKGPEFTAGEKAGTLTRVRDPHLIPDLLNPVTGDLKNVELTPSSPTAIVVNRHNQTTGKETRYTTEVRAGLNDSLWAEFGDKELTVSELTAFAENDTLSNLYRDMNKTGLIAPDIRILNKSTMSRLFQGKVAQYHYAAGLARPVIFISKDFGIASAIPTNETEKSRYLEIQKNALAEILGHELTHHITESVFVEAEMSGRIAQAQFGGKARQAKADWVSLFEAAKRFSNDPMQYGLTDVREFISEARNNPQFQAYLKTIPLPNNLSKRFKIKGRIWDGLGYAMGRVVQPKASIHALTGALMKQTLEIGALTKRSRARVDPIMKVLSDPTITPEEKILYTLEGFAINSIISRMPSVSNRKTLNEAQSINIEETTIIDEQEVPMHYLETTDQGQDYLGERLLPNKRYLLSQPRSQKNPTPPLSEVKNPMIAIMEGEGKRPADEDMWRLVRTPSFRNFYGDWMLGFQGVEGENPTTEVGFFRHAQTNEPRFIFHGRSSQSHRRKVTVTDDNVGVNLPAPSSQIISGKKTDIGGGQLDPDISDNELEYFSSIDAGKDGGNEADDTKYGVFLSLTGRPAVGWSESLQAHRGMSQDALRVTLRQRYLKSYYENFSMAGTSSQAKLILDDEIMTNEGLNNLAPIYLTSVISSSEATIDESELYPVPSSLLSGSILEEEFTEGYVYDEITGEPSLSQNVHHKNTGKDGWGYPVHKKNKAIGRMFYLPGVVSTPHENLVSNGVIIRDISNVKHYATVTNDKEPLGMIAIEGKDGQLSYFRVKSDLYSDPDLGVVKTSLTRNGLISGEVEPASVASPESLKSYMFSGEVSAEALGKHLEQVSHEEFTAHASYMGEQMSTLLEASVENVQRSLTGTSFTAQVSSIPSTQTLLQTEDKVADLESGIPTSDQNNPTWQDAANRYDVDVRDLIEYQGGLVYYDTSLSEREKNALRKEAKKYNKRLVEPDEAINSNLVPTTDSIQVPILDENMFTEGMILPLFTSAKNPLVINEEGVQNQQYGNSSSLFIAASQHITGARIPWFSQGQKNIPIKDGKPVLSGFYSDVHDLSVLYNMSGRVLKGDGTLTGGKVFNEKSFMSDPLINLRNPITALSKVTSTDFNAKGDTNAMSIESSKLEDLLAGDYNLELMDNEEVEEIRDSLEGMTSSDVHKYGNDLPSGKSALDPIQYFIENDSVSETISWMVQEGYSKADLATITSILNFGKELNEVDFVLNKQEQIDKKRKPKGSRFEDTLNNYSVFNPDGAVVPTREQEQAFKYALIQHAELAGMSHSRLLGLITLKYKLEQLSEGSATSDDPHFSFIDVARRLDETKPVVVDKDSTPFMDGADVFVQDGRMFKLDRMSKEQASQEVFGSIILNMSGVLNPPKTLVEIEGAGPEGQSEYAVVTPVGFTEVKEGMPTNTINWAGGARLAGVNINKDNTKAVNVFLRSGTQLSYGATDAIETGMYFGSTTIKQGLGSIDGQETQDQLTAGGGLLNNIPEEFIALAAADAELESTPSQSLIRSGEDLYGGNSTLEQRQSPEGEVLFDNGLWKSKTLLTKVDKRGTASNRRLYGEAVGSAVTNYITGGLVAVAKVRNGNLEQYKVDDMQEMKELRSQRKHTLDESATEQDLADIGDLNNQQYVLDLIKHGIADYIVNNRDGHAGNFGIANGHIVSFDKGQSFRFYQHNTKGSLANANNDSIMSMGTDPESIENEASDVDGIIHFLNTQFGKKMKYSGNPRIVYSQLKNLVSQAGVTPEAILADLIPVIKRATRLGQEVRDLGLFDEYTDSEFQPGLSPTVDLELEMMERLDGMKAKVAELIVYLTGRDAQIDVSKDGQPEYFRNTEVRTEGDFTKLTSAEGGGSIKSPKSISYKEETPMLLDQVIAKKREIVESTIPAYYATRLYADEPSFSADITSTANGSTLRTGEYAQELMSSLMTSTRSRQDDISGHDFIISGRNEDVHNGSQVILPFPNKTLKTVQAKAFDGPQLKRRIDVDEDDAVSASTQRTNAYDGTQAASNRLLLNSIEDSHKDAILKGYKGNLESYIKDLFKINPQENLKAIATRDAQVADLSIVDFDGNPAMTDRALRFAAELHTNTMNNLIRKKSRLEKKLDDAMDSIQEAAEEINALTTKKNDATVHEAKAQAAVRKLIKDYMRGMDGQVDLTFDHGKLLGSIKEVEKVLKGDTLSSVYRDALYDIFDGNTKVFAYIQAMAELGIDYANANETEIVSAINGSTKPELQSLKNNKPLMSTLVAFSKDKALQMALLEARTSKDTSDAGKIDDEIKRTQRLSEEQLKDLRREIKGIRKSVSKVYKVRDAYAQARLIHKRKTKQAEKTKALIKLHEDAMVSISGKEKSLQQRLGVGYNFTAVPGEQYFIMQKVGNDWVATKAVYSIEGTDENRIKINNAKYFNKAYLAEQDAKGKGDEPFNRMLSDMTMQLSKAVVHREYKSIHRNMLDRALNTLEQRLRATGQSGVQVTRMIAEFRRIQQNNRNEQVSLAGKWEGAYGEAIKASGMDQSVFKEMVYDTAIYWIENMPDLANDPTALYGAVYKEIEKTMKGSGKPVSPNLKGALQKLWVATENIAEWENGIADKHNVLVEDPSVQWSNPLTGSRENILRRRIKYGRITIPRQMRGEVIAALTTIMGNNEGEYLSVVGGWNNSDIFNQIKLLGKKAVGQDAAFDEMMGLADQLFNDTIINTFLDPLLSKPGDPIFTAPKKRGSNAKHPIPQDEVMSAWLDSGKSFKEFVVQLFLNQDADIQDLPAFASDMLGRLRQVYQMGRSIAVKVDTTPMSSETSPHRMMDARTNTIFPKEWLEYDTFTKVDAGIHVSKLASVAAFGRDSSILSGMMDAAMAEARQLQLPLAEIQQNPAYLGLKTEKERKQFLISKLGKERYESARDAARIRDEIKDLKKSMIDLFSAPGGGFKDMRMLEELASLNADLVLRTPKSGLWQALSGMDYTQRLGYGTLSARASGTFIYNSIKNVFGSLFNEGLGIPLMQATESAKAINYIRSTPGQQDLTFKELFANHGVQGTGEGIVRTSRKIKDGLDKSIGLKGGSAGSSGFAPFTPLSPFSWLNNVFGSAVAEGGVNVWRTIITRALAYIDQNPSVMGDPNFRFNLKHLGIKGSLIGGNERALEYLADTWAEHTGQSLLDFIKQSYNRKTNQQEIFSKEDYLNMYQIAMDDINLEGGIGSTPVAFRTNGILRVATPLLRWATGKSNAVHGSLQTQEGRYTINSVLKGLAGISAVGMPIGIAATMLMDEYDEEILGKKSNLRKVDPINLLPGFAAFNMLSNKDGQGLAILERLARSGNVYGLGMEAAYGMAAWTDPMQGQRALGIDRILVYSQLANARDAFVNIMHSGWYMNYEDGKKIVDVMAGQAPAHFTQTVNNLLMPINDNERRRVKRVDAYNYLRSAGRSAGVPLKKSGMRTNPTPLTARIRQMQLAAYGDDPEEFNNILQDAISAAVDMGKEDPIGSIVSSWKARQPMDLFQRTLTPDETEEVFKHMNQRGRENVLDLIRLHEKYLNYLEPRKVDFNRSMSQDRYNRANINKNRLLYLNL